jgi:hypothetical protein
VIIRQQIACRYKLSTPSQPLDPRSAIASRTIAEASQGGSRQPAGKLSQATLLL